MKTLEGRSNGASDAMPDAVTWERLIKLFEENREEFYSLACDAATSKATADDELAKLARRVRRAIAESFNLEASHEGTAIVSFSGERTDVPDSVVEQVASFLREVDGKSKGDRAGKDYEGSIVTASEILFRQGDSKEEQRDRSRIKDRTDTKPVVFRFPQAEIQQLRHQPGYATHQLLHCVRRVLAAPTAVYRGLNRGPGCAPGFDDGWIICGKPPRAYGNDGVAVPAPQGMVFAVFATANRAVFDWDWIREDPDEPGRPLDDVLRYREPSTLDGEAVFQLPAELAGSNVSFDPKKACYSPFGDCIFCYLLDDLAYGERINGDLTIFKSRDGRDAITGFKVKNIRRIVEEDKNVRLNHAPGLQVSVDTVLIASSRRNKDTSPETYSLVIRALFKETHGESPTVSVPEESVADELCAH